METNVYIACISGYNFSKYYDLYERNHFEKLFGLGKLGCDINVTDRGITFHCRPDAFKEIKAVIHKIEGVEVSFYMLTDNLSCIREKSDEDYCILVRLSNGGVVKITKKCCFLPDNRAEEGVTTLRQCTVGHRLMLGLNTSKNTILHTPAGIVTQILEFV